MEGCGDIRLCASKSRNVNGCSAVMGGWRKRLAAIHVCFVALFLLTTYTCRAEPVIFPHPKEGFDVRNSYPLKLLELALAKAGKHYRVVDSNEKMSQSRAILLLQQKKKINVLWTMTSKQREEMLLPIRFPIDKGLYGWRVCLVRKTDKAMLKDVATVQDLMKFKAIQGHDWPDFKILAANGLPVDSASNYASFFMMLTMRRVDYFPRSVVEIIPEYNAWRSQGIEIDEHIVLHYPTAFYYFVNRSDHPLALAIDSGLEQLLSSGEFDVLFRREFSKQIQQLKLTERKIIHLNNPDLPADTPLSRKALWFQTQGSHH